MTLSLKTPGKRLHVGSSHIAERAIVVAQDGAATYVLPFPHDRYNLSSGVKLAPGVWRGEQRITVTDTTVEVVFDLTALQAAAEMNIPLLAFDADRMDDAYLYADGDGTDEGTWLVDLGIDAGLKAVTAVRKRPAWGNRLTEEQVALLSREGAGLKITCQQEISGARLAFGTERRADARALYVNGTGFFVKAGTLNALLELADIRAGARVHVSYRIEGCNETDPAALPPNVVYPPLRWEEMRFFDSHGHLDRTMPLDDLIRACRKNKILFGVMAFEYFEGPGKRAFLGDWPVFEAMRKAPDVIAGFGFFNMGGPYPGCPPGDLTTADDIARFKRMGFIGVKSIQKWGGAEVDDPALDPVYRQIAATAVPMVFHNNPDWLCPCGAGRLAAVAERHPRIPAVAIAHAVDEADLEKLFTALRTLPNLYQQHMHYAKAEHLRRFREQGLAHKIVFATDVQNSPAALVHDAAVFDAELEKAGYTEAERAFCRKGYFAKWFSGIIGTE